MMLTRKHGTDIASQRMDELDVDTIIYALQICGDTGAAVDLGCGVGTQGLRLATLGFKTVLIDLTPIEMTVLHVAGISELLPLSYLQKDVRILKSTDLPANISICYSQRFIHYLTYAEATILLKLFRRQMQHCAKLFLSASGLFSELGEDYQGKNMEVSRRFSHLSEIMSKRHSIYAPVCLYTEDDLVNLCNNASFSCDKVYQSVFGNIKGVFTAI